MRVSHLDTSAYQIICHSIQLICQKMQRNLKMWWTNGRVEIIPRNISKVAVSHLDTWICQNVDCFPRDLSSIPKWKLTVGQLDARTDMKNKKNSHRHRCLPRASYLGTSACQILCHFLLVICQQICRNLKKQWTNGRTDIWADGGTNDWLEGISMPPSTWYRPPQLDTENLKMYLVIKNLSWNRVYIEVI